MTREFLKKVPEKLFWLSWLGIPYLMWLYSIVVELSKNLPKNNKLVKIILFGLLIYPTVYIPVGLTFLISGKADMETIMPFHIGAILCIILLMALTAVTIVRFERAEKLKQSNGIGLFFGIWFFIFGVWHIQPKLNEYVKRIK